MPTVPGAFYRRSETQTSSTRGINPVCACRFGYYRYRRMACVRHVYRPWSCEMSHSIDLSNFSTNLTSIIIFSEFFFYFYFLSNSLRVWKWNFVRNNKYVDCTFWRFFLRVRFSLFQWMNVIFFIKESIFI